MKHWTLWKARIRHVLSIIIHFNRSI